VRPEEREVRSKRRSVWPSLGLAFGVLALLYLGGWGITGARFRGELARLKAHGEPVAPGDLLPKLKPGERNAAGVYEQAFAQVSRRDLAQLSAAGSWVRNPSGLPLARRLVTDNAKFYGLLEKASRVPSCAFPVRWNQIGTPDWGDEEMRRLGSAIQALSVKLQVQTQDGDLDGALATCATAVRVADHAEQAADPGGRMVASAELVNALHGIGRVLSCGDPSPAACRKMADQLAARDCHARLVRAAKGERVVGLAAMRWMERGQWLAHYPPQSVRSAVQQVYPVVAKPMWNVDKEQFLQVMAAAVTTAKGPWPEMGAEVARFDKQMGRFFPAFALPVSWIPVTGRDVFAFSGRDAAMAGAWQVALALKAYHHDHGTYPATLAEAEHAGWKLPDDPFTGKPYRYRREAQGFTVWSVGFDLRDNGARPFAADVDDYLRPGRDFVVRCAR
jgi:hypothetical protein